MIKKFKNYKEYINKGGIGSGDVAYTEEDGIVIFKTNNVDGTYTKFVAKKLPSYIEATYNITATGNTKVCGFQSTSVAWSQYKMQVDDGEVIELNNNYNFTTTGEHKIKFIPNDGLATVTLTDIFYLVATVVSVDLSHLYLPITNIVRSFYKASKLKTINLTNIDTSINKSWYAAFGNCGALEEIIGWEDVDMTLAVKTNNIINYSDILFQECNKLNAKCPKKIDYIGSFSFNHTGSGIDVDETFNIPSSVANIGYAHVFYNFGKGTSLKRYTSDSPQFVVDKYGALYSANGKRLISIPSGMEVDNETYEIKEGVIELNELGLSKANPYIKNLVLPNSFVLTGYKDMKDGGMYVQMKNGGTNLQLFVYADNKIKNVLVKEDNPNYISIDGCIYSKDGKHLKYVPYTKQTDSKREVHIAEGCEYIDEEAFPLMSLQESVVNYTKITIPSTVKYIDDKKMHTYAFGLDYNSQKEILESLIKYGKVVVEIAEDNPYYKIENNKIVKK